MTDKEHKTNSVLSSMSYGCLFGALLRIAELALAGGFIVLAFFLFCKITGV